MAEKVQFEIASPERLVVSAEADMVVVPGAEGDFGVLPRHAPLMSTLRPGVVAVWRDNAVAERIFVSGGFAEVSAKGCTVLADEAVAVGDIDRAAVDAEIAKLRQDLAEAGEGAGQRTLSRRLKAAEAKRAAAG